MKPAQLTNAQCDAIADAVLRAAGSGLRYYSSPSIKDAIRDAVRDSIAEVTQ